MPSCTPTSRLVSDPVSMFHTLQEWQRFAQDHLLWLAAQPPCDAPAPKAALKSLPELDCSVAYLYGGDAANDTQLKGYRRVAEGFDAYSEALASWEAPKDALTPKDGRPRPPDEQVVAAFPSNFIYADHAETIMTAFVRSQLISCPAHWDLHWQAHAVPMCCRLLQANKRGARSAERPSPRCRTCRAR